MSQLAPALPSWDSATARPVSPAMTDSSSNSTFSPNGLSLTSGEEVNIRSSASYPTSTTTSKDTTPSNAMEAAYFYTGRSVFHRTSQPLIHQMSVGGAAPSYQGHKGHGLVQVNPAMLSLLAQTLLQYLQLDTHTKDSIEYTNCFRGSEVIDLIIECTYVKDRRLALVLARALEAQNFYHDVTYNFILRDTRDEYFAFNTKVASNLATVVGEQDSSAPDATAQPGAAAPSEFPNGVFTLLTQCYVPTCSDAAPCYSIICPRKSNQRRFLRNMAIRVLDKKSAADAEVNGRFWSTSVAKDVVAGVTEMERKRQEVIFELVLTEVEFVADLEIISGLYREAILESGVIQPERLDDFLGTLFLNVAELLDINRGLKAKLLERQQESPIFDKVGDILVAKVEDFTAYIQYGAKQVIARHTLDMERTKNRAFDELLKNLQKLPECRKLPIESFLGRPTTRMGRYPMLLKAILDKTPEGHPDRTLVAYALGIIKDILVQINAEAGKTENALKLKQLGEKLLFNPGEEMDLKLTEPHRDFLREGTVVLKKAGVETEVDLFLLDHFLILTRKQNGGYKVFKNPIPIQLLVLGASSEAQQPTSLAARTGNAAPAAYGQATESKGFPFTIVHIGRSGGYYTFSVPFQAERRSWIEAIEAAKSQAFAKQRIFELVSINNAVFPRSNRINCSTMYGNKLLLGTEEGLFVSDVPVNLEHHVRLGGNLTDSSEQAVVTFSKRIDLSVSQVDLLLDFDLVLILADKKLLTYPTETLDVQNTTARKGRKIAEQVSFFKQGICADRTLVCAVKSTALNATVKVLEPQGLGTSKLRGKIGKLFRGVNDSIRVFREFYIPTVSTSIHFLKSKLCVGCIKGFEIVDLDTLETQGLLDPKDERLAFIYSKESLRPISIFRTGNGEFLLCYNEFGFYVDRLGNRSRDGWLINWIGTPSAFTLCYPYILAYEPSLIEIWNCETAELEQIIPTNNLRNLNTDKEILHFTMDTGDWENQYLFRLQILDAVEVDE